MAREKKKEELSLEEKLEQALVPMEEQPYEVPENWCWVRLKSINQFEGESINPMNSAGDLFELYSVPSSEADYPEIVSGSEIASTKQLVQKDDVLLCKINPRINRVWYVKKYTENCLIASSEWIVIRSEMLNPKYLMWCMRAKYFREYMLSNVSGVGGSLMRAQPKYVNMYPIPLAPLEEQRRIAEKIESLFAKLDEAKEKVSDVVQSSEIRQLALINRLFTGELAGIKEAYTIPLFDIVEEIKIGPFGSSLHKEDYIMGGTPVINPKHISKQGINPDQEVSITSEKARELSSYVLKENDIIMGRRGEMGRTAPVSQKEEGYICGTGSLIIRLKKEFRADLYSQILGSQCVINHLEQNCVGSTMKNLNEKIVKQIPIPYFSKEQQEKLMFRFETMLAEEQQVLDKLGGIVDAISLIKKAILAKAFRGELGTNNPDEESAIELLKAVLM